MLTITGAACEGAVMKSNHALGDCEEVIVGGNAGGVAVWLCRNKDGLMRSGLTSE